jgi:hypothetical protein
MKVYFTSQTMSESIASTMEYLEAHDGVEQMAGCSATVKFVRTINFLFDVLNLKTSAQPAQQGSKAAHSLANIAEMEQKCFEAINYLFSLKINGIAITAHDRRTFVLGLATAIKSMFHVSVIILVRFPLYRTIETFQFSQDFLTLSVHDWAETTNQQYFNSNMSSKVITF